MNKVLLLTSIFLLSLPLSHAQEVEFTHKQDRLSGHYLAATHGQPAKAILLFVHGDGPLSYNAEGYYDLIWDALRQSGYAIFSWDKPGVNDSDGNWLEQSMPDRQSEVIAAIDFVQKTYHFSTEDVGLIGFSQAGWIVPALANEPAKIGFGIGIGFAANWVEQGAYYTKVRHELAGSSDAQIQAALDAYFQEIAFFESTPSYSKYAAFAGEEAMSQQRYQFVLKNYHADATKDYSGIQVPCLFLWGEDDLNVNAKQEIQSWKNHPNEFVTTALISNASHGMLNADAFNSQSMGFKQWLKLMWLGEDALAEAFLPTVIDWLEQQHNG